MHFALYAIDIMPVFYVHIVMALQTSVAWQVLYVYNLKSVSNPTVWLNKA